MGSGSSKSTETVTIKPVLRGYMYPEPPVVCVDDIRPPIPWYQDDEKDDEFDWSQLDGDVYSDTASIIPAGNATVPRSPKAGRRPPSVLQGALSNRYMKTPSGRPISFMSQERTRSVLQKAGSSVSAGGISLHPKTPSPYAMISFEKVDEQARKADKAHLQTYTALIDFLSQPARFHRMRELLTARAIIVWLAYQNVKKAIFTKANTATPKGLLQHLATGSITYATAYTILCREAGLQCVVIDGISKPNDFDPGDEYSMAVEDEWTAVYVDGCWQIVHPFWICRGLHGLGGSFDDWIRREVEATAQSKSQVVKTLKGLVKSFINEDYFMPAPEVFIHSSYADENKWQLLPSEYILRSREEFMSLPYIFPAFFRLGLKLVSEPRCVLESQDGIIRIWILSERHNYHRLTLTYQLYLLETNYVNTNMLQNNIQKLVVHSRHAKLFYFEIRFPIEGIFRLDIQGGFHESHSMRLCQFKLRCLKRLRTFKYIPFQPDLLMWGPGPFLDEVGLLLPSKPTGIIIFPSSPKQKYVSPDSDAVIVFPKKQLTFMLHPDKSKRVEFSAEIIGFVANDRGPNVTPVGEDGLLRTDKYKPRKVRKGEADPNDLDFSSCVSCTRQRVNNTNMFTVTVTVPHEGEFALIIKATPFTVLPSKAKVYEEETYVCVYLLRTIDEGSRDNVHQKLARAELQSMVQEGNTEKIRKAIDKCVRTKIDEHDDEVVAATTKWEYLKFKKELKDAIHRRNIRIINDSLRKVAHYRHRGALVFEIKRLFKLRKQIKMLMTFRDDIPALKDAGHEIANMIDPPPEVHLTMGALLLLLEENEKVIESWEYIVHQLSSLEGGHVEPPLYRKMFHVPELFPSNNTRRKILTLLAEFDVEKVRRTCPPASRFYFWVQKVMAVLEDVEFDFDYQIEDTELEEGPTEEERMSNHIPMVLAKVDDQERFIRRVDVTRDKDFP